MYPTGMTPRSNKKERKVSIVFRRTDEALHCAGVEALQLLPDDASLLSASRDSTIKRWGTNANGQLACLASFEGHADWVNDLALLGRLLFSCSNDKTVRVWQTNDTGSRPALLTTMCHHSDHVTCLSAARTTPWVASGGLRGELFLIDAESGVTHRLKPKVLPPHSPSSGGGLASHRSLGGGGPFAPYSDGSNGAAGGGQQAPSTPQTKGPSAGIYSVAMSCHGNVVAAGSSDSFVRLWDCRTGEKIGKLRGHTDNVRCLLVKDDLSQMLSGSSDGTIKLWDLGMQRCIQTYAVHSDSVWCLLPASPDWSVVYSGGRDRHVYRTRLATRSTELLVQEQQPVTALAGVPQGPHLWVSTTASSINLWTLPTEPTSPRESAHAGVRRRPLTVQGAGSVRKSIEPRAPHVPPLVPQPTLTIPGVPVIIAHKVLSDRRFVLCRDEQGHVGLWDVLAGGEVAQYGQVDMDAKECELFEAKHCPSWFTADNRLGTLAISLEPPQCFNAEDYALALGYTNVTDDVKLNYGKIVLECAFAKWQHQAVLQLQHTGGSGPGSQASAHSPHSTPGGAERPGGAAPQRLGFSHGSGHLSAGRAASSPRGSGHHGHVARGASSTEARDEQPVSYYPEEWPKFWLGVLPSVICQSASGAPWHLVINRFTGLEAEPEDVPAWVGDVVLRNAAVQPKESKCAFVLQPAEGAATLPSLPQSRLNAPRILQVHKVASYCVARLQEVQIQLDLRPVYLRRPPHTLPDPPEVTPGSPQRYDLEITCNGLAVPYEMSLSAVKKFIWGKPGDVLFEYRVRDPLRPAPMPHIHPPKAH